MGSIAASGDGDTMSFADARAARAAMAAAGSHSDLDTALGCAAEVLCSRFGADHASYLVHHWEHQPHATGVDSVGMDGPWLQRWVAHPDRHFRSQVAGETMPLIVDLRAIARSPSQEESLALGVRSGMQLALRDERGEVFGLVTVASLRPGAFTPEQLEEFRELVALSAGFVRRALLSEQVQLERSLMEQESALLSALARSDTTGRIPQAIANGIRQAIGADLVVIFSRALDTAELVPVFSFSPDDLLTDRDWAALRAAIAEDGNQRVVLSTGECYVNTDLTGSAPSPVEAWLRDTLQHSSVLIASGRVTETRRFAIAATRSEAGPWNSSVVAFLSRAAALLEMHIGRNHTQILAGQQSERLAAQARLLNTFNVSAPPDEVTRLFADELRRFLGADTVTVLAFDHDTGTRVRVALASESTPLSIPERAPLSGSASYHGMLDREASVFDAREPEKAPGWLRGAATELGLGSVIAARLDVEGTPVGMIAAGSAKPGSLGVSDLHILTEAAAPLAMLLEQARIVTSLQQQTERTEAVLDILAALGPQDTLEQIGHAVAVAIRAMYCADYCAIAVLHDGEMTVAGIDSASPQQWAREGAAPVAGVAGPAAESARFEPLPAQGMLSMLRVPVGSQSAPLGFVTVASARAGAFAEADTRQLTQIVQPLGVIVNYFHGRREAEHRTLRLECTNRILTRLSAGGTAEHLAAGFLAECSMLFDCEHAVVVHFDHERSVGRLLAMNSSVIDAAALPASLSLDVFSSARFVHQPTPHVIPDTRSATEPGAYHAELSAAGLHSTIRAPLMVQDAVHGTVALWTRGANAYAAEDAELLGTLTRPLAIALEKAAALQSLGESELKYRSLVAQAEEMIFQFDSETRVILDANTHTATTLGYTPHELLALRLDDIIEETPDDIAEDIAKTVESGELHLLDKRFRRSDGTLFEVDMVDSLISYGGRRAVLVLARDVSERKAFQRQLVQGQKMESLGTMAGHVAHDFNNLLTTILGFAGLLKRSEGMDEEQRENLALIEDAARRAADLTGHLLSFARGGLVRFGPVDLRNVVNDTMRLAAPSMNDSLHASARLPATPVIVEGDAGQLQQALFNIVSNARDAMPEGGTIEVDLSTDGVTAVLTISDNGPGMDEETKTRIFEPFYTTKPLGTGTGLGMAITYGIVQGHHGDVALNSTRGKGTTFTITLPLLPGGTSTATVDAFNAGEGNLVLVVDDDEMVRRTTSATLAELGYNVVEAPGGATAVEIVRARPDRFSVVLLDLVMPGMTGSETFRALTAIRADLPVVVCTGYAADSHIDIDVKRRIAGLVQKPFTGERLGKALLAAGALPTRKPAGAHP